MPADEEVDTKVVGKAFKVEITPGGFIPIKSYSGGNPVSEKAETSAGASKSGTATPRGSVSELKLEAYITANNKVLATAAHRVANLGAHERFTVTITELAKDKSVVKTFTIFDCLFTSLDFPKVSAQCGEILTETATFKPERLEVS
jgi:hypothetical protein